MLSVSDKSSQKLSKLWEKLNLVSNTPENSSSYVLSLKLRDNKRETLQLTLCKLHSRFCAGFLLCSVIKVLV